MKRIIIDNFLRGVLPGNVNGHNHIANDNMPGLPGQFVDGAGFPFSNGKIGYVAPDPGVTNITNMSTVITDTPRNIVIWNDNNGNAYSIGSNGRLYELTGSTFTTTTNDGDYPRAIASASNGYDIIIFEAGGTTYLVYSYDASGQGRLGWTSNPTAAGPTFTEGNNLSNTAAAPNPMCVGADSHLYIGAGNRIDRILRTAAIALSLDVAPGIPSDFVITSIRNYQDRLAILAYRNAGGVNNIFGGECRFYLWDYASPTFDLVLTIQDHVSGALYVKDGLLYAFTEGYGNLGKLRYFNGNDFPIITYFGTTLSGAAAPDVPRHGNPGVFQNMLMWGTSQGLYSWGHPIPGRPPVLNNFGIATSGFIRPLLSVNTYYFHRAHSAELTYSNTSSGFGAADVYLAYLDMPHRAAIGGLRVYYSPLQNNGESLTVRIEVNEDNTLRTVGTITAATDDGVNEVSKYFPFSHQDVDKIQIILAYDSSSGDQVYVRKIEIMYEDTDYV